MNDEQMLLTVIRGTIAGLDTLDQSLVAECAAKLRQVLLDAGEHGPLAIALVGAEMAVDMDEMLSKIGRG